MPNNNSKKPMAVYTVREGAKEGDKEFWLQIGAAFPHTKGDGFNILLNALPLGEKLVVRAPKVDEAEPATE